jgi:cobalt-zinc-cadmium efflux system membrane fusion protein
MKPIQIVTIIAALLVLQACQSSTTEQAANEEGQQDNTITLSAAQQKMAAIVTGNMTRQTIDETIQLTGSIDVPPQNIISVSFPLGGYLKSTKLLPGMHVSKGESIAVMEDQSLVQLQQDYLTAKEKLKLSKLDYDRQKSLNETKVSADKVLQQAQTEYEANRILVLGLAEKLRLIHINPDQLSGDRISRMVSIPSPINGFVSKVNVNIGKYVQPADVLFELINPSDIHAALTVFEKDLNAIQIGQKVRLSFVDEPATLYDAEVILITKNVDENRSGIVHCHFQRMPPNLKPGMFIQASIQISSSLVSALPEEAVVRFENQSYIFGVKANGVFEAVPVTIGKRHGGYIEIISPKDVQGIDKFVTKNAFTVLSAWKNLSEE